MLPSIRSFKGFGKPDVDHLRGRGSVRRRGRCRQGKSSNHLYDPIFMHFYRESGFPPCMSVGRFLYSTYTKFEDQYFPPPQSTRACIGGGVMERGGRRVRPERGWRAVERCYVPLYDFPSCSPGGSRTVKKGGGRSSSVWRDFAQKPTLLPMPLLLWIAAVVEFAISNPIDGGDWGVPWQCREEQNRLSLTSNSSPVQDFFEVLNFIFHFLNSFFK